MSFRDLLGDCHRKMGYLHNSESFAQVRLGLKNGDLYPGNTGEWGVSVLSESLVHCAAVGTRVEIGCRNIGNSFVSPLFGYLI